MSRLLMPLAQAEVDAWADSFFGLGDDERFVILILVIACSTGLILGLAGIIGGICHSLKQKQIEADLKQDMLDRGMTAEEIARVVEAGRDGEPASSAMTHVPTTATPAATV